MFLFDKFLRDGDEMISQQKNHQLSRIRKKEGGEEEPRIGQGEKEEQ